MNLIKVSLVVMVIVIVVALLNLWYQTYVVGVYYVNAGIGMSILGGLAPIALLVIAFYAIKGIVKFDSSSLN